MAALLLMAMAAVLRADEVNLAQGRPVVASGPTTGSPALVTDGDAATYTHPTSAGVIGFYYQIDLGREYPIEQIHLYSQINANPNRLSKVRMSVYSDGGGVPGVERWKHVIRPGGENNPQGGVDILTAGLDPAGTFRGRYVRITNDGLSTNCPDVAEIEVFEAPAPDVTSSVWRMATSRRPGGLGCRRRRGWCGRRRDSRGSALSPAPGCRLLPRDPWRLLRRCGPRTH